MPLECSPGINLKAGTQNLCETHQVFCAAHRKMFGDTKQREETQHHVIVALMILANKHHISSLNRSCGNLSCRLWLLCKNLITTYKLHDDDELDFIFCVHVCDFNQVFSTAATLFARRIRGLHSGLWWHRQPSKSKITLYVTSNTLLLLYGYNLSLKSLHSGRQIAHSCSLLSSKWVLVLPTADGFKPCFIPSIVCPWFFSLLFALIKTKMLHFVNSTWFIILDF